MFTSRASEKDPLLSGDFEGWYGGFRERVVRSCSACSVIASVAEAPQA